MAGKKQVFVSYHYDNDRHYKNLLLAWNENKQFDFHMRDHSPGVAINSTDAATIKRVLSHKINEGKYFIVIIGKQTRKCEWVKWEIEKAKELKKKIIAVKIHSKNKTPSVLYRAGAQWVYSFKLDTIKSALAEA
jgi:hypothetical protein